MLTKLAIVVAVIFGALLLLALIVPFLLPRPGLDGKIPDQPFADSRFAEINGVRMHWRDRSRAADPGVLVVLIHGFGASGFSWRSTLDALEQAGYPAIAPDLPPFGYSERTGKGADWGELVLGVADRVCRDCQLVLVGHSMGAGVAAEVSALAGNRVRQAIFVDGTPGLRRVGGGFGWALAIPSLRRAAEVYAAWKLVDEQTIGSMLASAFGREPSAEELAGYYPPLTIPGTYPALLQRMQNRSSSVPSGWDQVPLGIIWGENDNWVPVDAIRRYSEAHPRLRAFEQIPEAGHNPMDTHPEAFNVMLLKQIESLD
ncbi:MAG: alpha/beta hydrolase [Wenzhouxiangellaceae bacterium]|nr:alpha/beta hydrolase [Wenzhouxiangellaceae bacterium]